MDGLARDSYLWALILELTKTYGFQRLLPLPEEGHDLSSLIDQHGQYILLFRNQARKYQLIRIQTVDFIWPAMLSRDIRKVVDQAPHIRKRLKASQLLIDNIYVLPDGQGDWINEVLSKMKQFDEQKCKTHSEIIYISEARCPTKAYQFSTIGSVTRELTQAVQQHVETKPLWEMKHEVEQEDKRKEQEFNQTFHYGKPYLTYFFILLNLLMFGYLEWVGSSTDVSTLITYGAKWNPSILAGEYWRFFTPMFLHIGFLHIMFNGLALYFLGSLVERIYGSVRFFLVYVISGFMGVVASFAFTDNVAAGASGAIFGCFGAMLYFGLKRRDLFFRTLGSDIIFVLFFNLGIGAVIPMIDNYAHIGGLVGGFLGAMMVHLPRHRLIQERMVALGVLLIISALLLQIGFTKELDSPVYHLTQADLDLRAEQWIEASSHLERAIHLGSDQAEVYFQLAYAELQLNKLEEGKLNLLKTIERDPQLVEAYYNLALVYLELDQPEQALEVLETARKKDISTPTLDELHQKILTHYE